MTTVTEFAPAKINLTLHVTGRREDGYHLLESLVAFADVGDQITVRKGPVFSLTASGPFAADLPAAGDNIVMAAAQSLAHGVSEVPPGAEIHIEKNLPVASGIGGGSANAAACLRALLKLHDVSVSDAGLNQIAVFLGADVPVCLHSQVSVMSGIGQIVEPAPRLPEIYAVLVNPQVAVPTGPVFSSLGLLQGKVVAEAAPALPKAAFHTAEDLVGYLQGCRNDLEPAAASFVYEIGDVQTALFSTQDCLMTRMSGSGATCFGLYAREDAAQEAAARIQSDHRAWWVVPARLG